MNQNPPLYSPDDAWWTASVMYWCMVGVFVTIVVVGVLQ